VAPPGVAALGVRSHPRLPQREEATCETPSRYFPPSFPPGLVYPLFSPAPRWLGRRGFTQPCEHPRSSVKRGELANRCCPSRRTRDPCLPSPPTRAVPRRAVPCRAAGVPCRATGGRPPLRSPPPPRGAGPPSSPAHGPLRSPSAPLLRPPTRGGAGPRGRSDGGQWLAGTG